MDPYTTEDVCHELDLRLGRPTVVAVSARRQLTPFSHVNRVLEGVTKSAPARMILVTRGYEKPDCQRLRYKYMKAQALFMSRIARYFVPSSHTLSIW